MRKINKQEKKVKNEKKEDNKKLIDLNEQSSNDEDYMINNLDNKYLYDKISK